MKEKAFRELHMELCWNIVKGGKKMDYINAFWVGGLICALAQILLDRTKMMPGRVMVSLVVLGCILGFVQIFKPLQEYAGAGVSVPLLGFGNTLWNGVKEAVDKEGYRNFSWRIQGKCGRNQRRIDFWVHCIMDI